MILSKQNGQSLVEVLVGIFIGAILIGASTIAISSILKSSATSEKGRVASALNQELMDKVKSFGGADWQNINNLTEGMDTAYFLNASSGALLAVPGKEGLLDNDVTSGLIGEWKFDEAETTTSTTVYDVTGNNNGVLNLTNGPIRTANCKIANCLNFDGGDDYVNAPAGSNYSNDVTVIAWFKGGSQTAGDWNYWIQTNVNWLEFGTFGDNVLFKDNNALKSVNAGNGFIDNNWHQAIGIIRSNVMEIWIDGALRNSLADYPTGQSHINVGYRIGGNGIAKSWAGLIDDARIYNRAFSANEVKQVYGSSIFTRFFTTQNICRVNDATGAITGLTDSNGSSTTCLVSSGSYDPSTEQITSRTQWTIRSGSNEQVLSSYLTRFQNAVFEQIDWSGGSGQLGPVTNPNTQFYTSANVDISTTTGAITIHGISPTGGLNQPTGGPTGGDPPAGPGGPPPGKGGNN